MLEFWMAALCMVLVAGAFFIPVLRGGGQKLVSDRRRLNLAIYQQRHTELTDEGAVGGNLQALIDELDRSLLDELNVAPEAATTRFGAGRRTLIIALLLLPLLGSVLYLLVGRPDLAGYRTQATASAEPQMTTVELQQSIARLVERLKKQPDDLESWALLARSYQYTEQYDLALATWENALRVAPDNLDVMAAYAQALAEANEGRISAKSEQLIKTILEKDANHPEALWLAGLMAAQQGKPTEAIEYWQRLKARFLDDSEPARQLAEHIAELRVQAESSSQSAKSAESAVGAATIRVSVRLDNSLTERVLPEDTLFIFARAASGPPMPLAVVRRQAKDLPLEVTLDDGLAMRPNMKLSAFPEIVVGARISRNGQPTPVSGDLQGLTGVLKPVSGERYQVVIDQRLP